MLKIESGKMLTYCTAQYLGAKCVWMEYAACRYLHTLRGPMIICNQPSAAEKEGSSLGSGFTALPKYQFIFNYMPHYQ